MTTPLAYTLRPQTLMKLCNFRLHFANLLLVGGLTVRFVTQYSYYCVSDRHFAIDFIDPLKYIIYLEAAS